MPYRFEVQRDEIDGVPVIWTEAPEETPFFAGLVFRVGRVDEALRIAGINHLVEHLAVPAEAPSRTDFNASVDSTKTTFWASGNRDATLEFLTDVTRRLVDLPLDRLERERTILMTEAADRARGHVEGSLSLRYGARGPGLIAYEEIGLGWLGPDDLATWSREWFCRENCVVYMSQRPPDTLELELPPGERRRVPTPEPRPGVGYPSVFTEGPEGSVALSMTAERSVGTTIGFEALFSRVRERLRYRQGVTYDVGTWLERLSDEVAHLTIWADCLPENATTVRNVLLTELDELAHTGPTDAERERDQAELEKALADPAFVPTGLFGHAELELVGPRFYTVEDLRVEREATTSADIAASFAAASETLLLVVPPAAGAPGGRFTKYPEEPDSPLRGRKHRVRGFPRPRRRTPHKALIVGEEGVSYVGVDLVVNVPYADVVAAQRWPEGELTVWGLDGSRITIVPGEWRGGDQAELSVRERLPGDVLVEMPGEDEALRDPDFLAALDAAQRGDLARAQALSRAAVERHPESAPLRCALATYLAELRRWDEAIGQADRALEIDPTAEAAHRARARALKSSGRLAEAVEEVRRALDLYPSELDTLAEFAWIAGEAGHESEARRAAARAVELYPDSGAAWFARGWTELSLGNRAEAEPALRRAVELEPEDAMWHNNLAWLLLCDGRPGEALKSLERALELEPGHSFAQRNRVVAVRELGRAEEAARMSRELVEAELTQLASAPDDADTAFDRSRLLRQLGRIKEAVVAAEQAVELAPERGELRGNLSWLCLGTRRWEEAVREAEEALRLAPEEPNALDAAAITGALTDRPEMAEAAATTLNELHPGLGPAGYVSGCAAYAAGRFDEAAVEFAKTLAREPLDCCSQAWLAATLHASGDHERAAEHAALGRLRCVDGGRCASLNELARRERG